MTYLSFSTEDEILDVKIVLIHAVPAASRQTKVPTKKRKKTEVIQRMHGFLSKEIQTGYFRQILFRELSISEDTPA